MPNKTTLFRLLLILYWDPLHVIVYSEWLRTQQLVLVRTHRYNVTWIDRVLLQADGCCFSHLSNQLLLRQDIKTFPQASYDHIQALKILKVTHPFSVQQSVSQLIWKQECEMLLFWIVQDEMLAVLSNFSRRTVIFQSPERRAPPCGQSWSYIQPQVHFWAPAGDFTNSPFPWISLTSPSHIKLYMVFNNIAWWKLHWLFAVLRLVS